MVTDMNPTSAPEHSRQDLKGLSSTRSELNARDGVWLSIKNG